MIPKSLRDFSYLKPYDATDNYFFKCAFRDTKFYIRFPEPTEDVNEEYLACKLGAELGLNIDLPVMVDIKERGPGLLFYYHNQAEEQTRPLASLYGATSYSMEDILRSLGGVASRVCVENFVKTVLFDVLINNRSRTAPELLLKDTKVNGYILLPAFSNNIGLTSEKPFAIKINKKEITNGLDYFDFISKTKYKYVAENFLYQLENLSIQPFIDRLLLDIDPAYAVLLENNKNNILTKGIR